MFSARNHIGCSIRSTNLAGSHISKSQKKHTFFTSTTLKHQVTLIQPRGWIASQRASPRSGLCKITLQTSPGKKKQLPHLSPFLVYQWSVLLSMFSKVSKKGKLGQRNGATLLLASVVTNPKKVPCEVVSCAKLQLNFTKLP